MTVAPESIRASRLHLTQGIDVCTIEWCTRVAARTQLLRHEVESIRFSRTRKPLIFRATLHDFTSRQEPMHVEVTVEHTDWAAWLAQPINPELAPPYNHTRLDVQEDALLLGCRNHKIRSIPNADGCHQAQVVTHHICTIDPDCDCNGYRHTTDVHSLGLTESYQPAFQ